MYVSNSSKNNEFFNQKNVVNYHYTLFCSSHTLLTPSKKSRGLISYSFLSTHSKAQGWEIEMSSSHFCCNFVGVLRWSYLYPIHHHDHGQDPSSNVPARDTNQEIAPDIISRLRLQPVSETHHVFIYSRPSWFFSSPSWTLSGLRSISIIWFVFADDATTSSSPDVDISLFKTTYTISKYLSQKVISKAYERNETRNSCEELYK